MKQKRFFALVPTNSIGRVKQRIMYVLLALGMMLTSQSALAQFANLTALSGSGGTGSEGYAKLVDGKLSTKVCTSINSDGAFIIVKAEKALVPSTYDLVTGNDTQSFPDRNWKTWKIYGGNFASDAEAVRNADGWTLIDERTGVELPTGNCVSTTFEFSKSDGNTSYNYFWIELTDVVGGSGHQMSEWRIPVEYDDMGITSGNTYYLYNVESELFLGYAKNSTSTMGVSEDPLPIQMTVTKSPTYNMRVTSITNGYIYSYDSYCRTNSWYSADHDYCSWAISKVDDEYLIQRSPLNTQYYNADQYLGWQGDNATEVHADRPITDAVHWRLIPADVKGDRFVAAEKLRKALKMAEPFEGIGWYLAYYEDLYAARETADIEEMTNAAYVLRNGLNMLQGYKAPYWNEYPILWQCSEGKFGDNMYDTWALPDNYNTTGKYFQRCISGNGESTLSATVNVDEPSTFIYSLSGGNDINVKVYVDDVLVRELVHEQTNQYPSAQTAIGYCYTRFFEALTPGTHKITWHYTRTKTNSSDNYYIRNIGVMKSPLITVSLLEPGSLGTEVLYNTDHIKNVRRLKVKGKMNNDDWAKIKMMHYLQDLDLSEAEIVEIPEKQFSCDADTSSLFIHRMKLPEGLTTIKKQAFYYSFIDHLDFPSTVNRVEGEAFSHSHIQELSLPDILTDLPSAYNSYNDNDYTDTFAYMYWLKKVVCPKNLTDIPRGTFYQNYFCKDVVLPEELEEISRSAFERNYIAKFTFPNKLKTIGVYAFSYCYNADFSPLPESLESIGEYAFRNCESIASLKIPENVSYIGQYAFQDCHSLKNVEISTKIYNLATGVFDKCNSLETLRMNCPTVVTYSTNTYYYPVASDHIKDVKLVVPNHIVTSYKLDNYWYNFKAIEGFSTAEIQDWTINRPLVLNRDRFEGTPNITITGSHDRFPSLKINGDYAQQINNLVCCGSRYDYENYPGQILSQCNDVTINGSAAVDLENTAKYWYFFSLPFDMKISDIYHGYENIQKAIRYYDGANRAAVGATGSWKNYEADAVIPAGTGFIMQTNEYTWSRFYAVDNESKQNMVSYKEFVKTLDVNDSQNASNKGWNLVGNPWQCFYNTHMLNFTGPITVWSTRNRTYTAYSITDDDYALRPNEAFFVQCPSEEYNTIGFPTQGRQLTPVIESQNAVKAWGVQASKRQIINLTISNGEMEDQTRVVLNEKASMGYETICDASKFWSMDNNVPQLYTLDATGTQYAINERPLSDGSVQLGFYAGVAGRYTISVKRCDAEQVFITDCLTGVTEEITNSEYAFNAEAGTCNSRFVLTFNTGNATGIINLQMAEQNGKVEVFSTDGKFLGTDASRLDAGVYVIRQGKKVSKVVVR